MQDDCSLSEMIAAAEESEQVADIAAHPGKQEFPAGDLEEYLDRYALR